MVCTKETDATLEELAEFVHLTMEKFDPSEDYDWDRLRPMQKECYRECVRMVLREESLVRDILCRKTALE